jgi:hypothetical protein
MLRNLIWCLCVGAGVFALGTAGYFVCKSRHPDGPLLVVEEPERDLGSQPLGEQSLEFRLTNHSDHALRVSGPPGG